MAYLDVVLQTVMLRSDIKVKHFPYFVSNRERENDEIFPGERREWRCASWGVVFSFISLLKVILK